MQGNDVKRQKIDYVESSSYSQDVKREIHPEVGWNDEMRAFYNSSWGLNVYNPTNADAVQWTDFPSSPKKKRNCSMCGNTGHEATTCPASCCLKVSS